MTNEEAIVRISKHMKIHKTNEPHAIFITEALSMAISALEKQIPKKPLQSDEPRYGMGNEYYDWICPNCGEWLAWQCDPERFNICHCQCGQKLDWER